MDSEGREIMKLTLCVLILAMLSPAQTLNFSPQPSSTVEEAYRVKLKDITVWSVWACAPAGSTGAYIPSGKVYALAMNHFNPISRSLVLRLGQRQYHENKFAKGSRIVGYVLLAMSVAAGTKTLSANQSIQAGMGYGSLALPLLGGILKQNAPQLDSAIESAVLFSALTAVPGGCSDPVPVFGQKNPETDKGFVVEVK